MSASSSNHPIWTLRCRQHVKENTFIDKSPADSKSPSSSLWRSVLFLKKYRNIAVGVYLLALVVNALSILIPQTIRWIIDVGIVQQNMSILLWSLAGLITVTVVKGIVDFVLGRWTEVASQGVAYDVRNAIYDKLSSLSFSYHDQAQTGQLLARSISDVERIRFLTGRGILRALSSYSLDAIYIFCAAIDERAARGFVHALYACAGLCRLALWTAVPTAIT